MSISIIKELEKKFLVDSNKLLQSHSTNRAFNIFHEDTALKIDLFPAHNDFHKSQLDRAISVKLPSAHCTFKIATPEDIILAKLLWTLKSPSERQLSDIKGVFRINKDSLDIQYLNKWAERLNVFDQLNQLFAEQ